MIMIHPVQLLLSQGKQNAAQQIICKKMSKIWNLNFRAKNKDFIPLIELWLFLA